LGIPRRITVRVILFALLIAAVPVGAFYAIRWYAYDNWYPSVQGSHIVIEQGRAGGVLWFKPRVVDHTGVTTAQILPAAVTDIHSGVEEPSLKAAKKYVANLHQAFCFQHPVTCGTAGGTGSGGLGPSGSIPSVTTSPSGTGVSGGSPAGSTTTTTPTAP
jgi:protein phosphatase